MSNIKILTIKFVILIAIIISLNYLYKYTFWKNDIETHSDVIDLVHKIVKDKSEIIYVAESSNITFRGDDIDKRTIGDFISDYYPSKKFGSLTKEASHAGIYYELLRNIPENSNVKTVIVTLNLRSFDANWIFSNLETPLQKSIVLLKDYPPLFNRFLLSFRGYDIKTDNEREKQFKSKWKHDILKFPYPFKYSNVIEWDGAMFHNGIKNPDGSINQPLTELACHYIKTYAFQIDTLTNPRIKDFDNIVSLAHKRNWHLIFNLLAENMDKADSLVGKELTYLIKQNRDLLVKRYNRNNVTVVDNLDSIHNSEFIDQNWTTEHYAENGRKMIAKNVAECLKSIYPKEYVKVSYKSIKPNEFFNDCEGNNMWGQFQTCSSDKSFSGKKSSKTGQKQDYSITFEYAIKNLPDSAKEILINFQLFQNDINHDAKLVIDISGNNIQKYWNGTLIKDLTKISQKWNEISYSYKLPNDFYKGDIIKIFVLNSTNTLIYIDDLKIRFK